MVTPYLEQLDRLIAGAANVAVVIDAIRAALLAGVILDDDTSELTLTKGNQKVVGIDLQRLAEELNVPFPV